MCMCVCAGTCICVCVFVWFVCVVCCYVFVCMCTCVMCAILYVLETFLQKQMRQLWHLLLHHTHTHNIKHTIKPTHIHIILTHTQ